MAPPPGGNGARARRGATTAIATDRFAGQVSAEDLLDALLAAEERQRTSEARLAAARATLRGSAARQRVVSEAARVLRDGGSGAGAIETVLRLLRRGLGAERAFFVEAQGEEVRVRASAGVDGGPVELPDYSLSLGIVREVVRTGEPSLSRDARADGRYGDLASVRTLELRSLACVPVRWDGAVRGALHVDHARTEGAFRRRDLRVLVATAELLGAALERAPVVLLTPGSEEEEVTAPARSC
jgi:GAF domain-containing protein